MPPIVAVAVDAPLRRLFDYRPPAGSTDDALVPGTRLWVPFGRRRAVGVVIELRSRSDVPAAKLRTAIAKIGSEPIFDRALLELLVWAADYYRHPIGEVIAAALPGPLRTGADAEATYDPLGIERRRPHGWPRAAQYPRASSARDGERARGAPRRR